MEKDFGVKVVDPIDWDYEVLERKHSVTREWIEKQFDDEWFWSKVPAFQKNIEQLRFWKAQGNEIHIVTSRPQKTLALVTRHWLKNHDVPFDFLSFQPLMHKVDYLKNNDISVMFEDMCFEAKKIGSFGLTCFVLRQEWNARYEARVTNPLVVYIDSMDEADDFIGGKRG